MIEEANKIPKTTNWEERIEHKINILFDEILELETELQRIKDNFYKDKLKKEKKELEYQLEGKTITLQNIENASCNYYATRSEKRDRFNGIKER
jgi:hypothetical protein